MIGSWRLRRRLRDDLTATSGGVDGRLVLAADGDGIEWSESGTLLWAGGRTEVTRRYRLEPHDGWWVHFDDGRPFHPWQPGVVVDHPCVADLYRGLVRVDGPDHWRVLWDVTGPTKRHRILTRLDRLG